MDVLDLSRWQFGITTVYHFFFVPITLGLVWFVAAFQTIWYVTGKEKYLKLTKFFGKLFLINFAKSDEGNLGQWRATLININLITIK